MRLFLALLLLLLPSLAMGQTVTPTRAYAFGQTVCINGHIGSADAAYRSPTTAAQILADIQYFGATCWRDALANDSTTLSYYTTLSNAGITFTMVPFEGDPTNAANMIPKAVSILNATGKNSIRYLEGPDEPDSFPANSFSPAHGSQPGYQGVAWLMQDYYQKLYANAQLVAAGVKMANTQDINAESPNVGLQFPTIPSGGGGTTWGAPGGEQLFDAYNYHFYPQWNGGYYQLIDQNTPLTPGDGAAQINDPDAVHFGISENYVQTPAGYAGLPYATVTNGAHPILYTEWNWNTNAIGNPTAREIAHMNGYLIGYQHGIALSCVYVLYPNGNGDEMFAGPGNPEPVAVGMHNLTTILQDNAANAATFTPAAVGMTISGMPADGQSFVTEKANGHYQVVMWRNTTDYNLSNGSYITVPPVNVTVTFANTAPTISTFKPLNGTGATSTLTNATTVTVALADDPMIVDANPGGTAPTESVAGATVTTAGPAIEASPTPGSAGCCVAFTITAGGAIAANGTTIGGANVTELYYTGGSPGANGATAHSIYQENASGNWYGPMTATTVCNAACTTVPSPVVQAATESPAGTTVTTVGPVIQASPTPGSAGCCSAIAITAGGAISVNGTTVGGSNVVELYYTGASTGANGAAAHTAYQENTSNNWFGPITTTSVGSQVGSPIPSSVSNNLSDLTNAAAHPTGGTAGFPATKAAYAIHLYPTNVLNQTPDTPLATVVPIWNTYWGTLSNTKPVMVTETGCDCDNSNGQLTDDQNFMNIFTAYVNGTAAGGPVLSGGQQPISTDWYSWGTYTENPNGTLNANGTIKTGQQTYWTVLLMTSGTIVPPAGRVVPIILGYNEWRRH